MSKSEITYVNIDVRSYKKEKQVAVTCSRRVSMPDGEEWSATKSIDFDTFAEALDWLSKQGAES